MEATDKMLVRSKSGLRIIAANADDASPFLLQEPQWVPDNSCSHCMAPNCSTKFDFMKRRHHCRRCGQCFCNSCCETKLSLPRMCFVDPVRVCGNCAEVTKRENEFFDKHLKVLITGGQFVVADSEPIDDNGPSLVCKLSSSHRYLFFEEDMSKRENIYLDKIESVQILTCGTDPQGNMVGTGIAIRYRLETGEEEMIKLQVASTPNRKQAMLWVLAMQKYFGPFSHTGPVCSRFAAAGEEDRMAEYVYCEFHTEAANSVTSP